MEKVFKFSPEIRERRRNQMRLYRATHPEYLAKECERSKERNIKYPEKTALAQRKWRESHRAQWNAYMQSWKKKNPERAKELQIEYRKRNIESIRVKEAQKLRRRLKVAGSFTKSEWMEKKEKYGFTCPACGRKEPEITLTVDHIKAVINGGTHDIDNLQPLCAHCNFSKRTKEIAYEPWVS